MEFIFENPLARMYGPLFLICYVLLFIGVFLYSWLVLPTKIGKSKSIQEKKIPEQLDPYEIICISQSGNDLLALVIFNLVRRGFFILELRVTTYYIKAGNAGNIHLLSELEKDVYSELDIDRSLAAFVQKLNRSLSFKAHCDSIQKRLELEGMIWGSREKRDFDFYRMMMLFGLLALGIYKIIVSLHHNHTNIFGIIFVSIIGCMAVMWLKIGNMPTDAGQRFLENLKTAFKPVYGNGLLKQPAYIEQTLLAVYGFTLLNHSAYAYFYAHVLGGLVPQNSVYFETGSGGSSCSGGSGCGSSCGGGCGGCGGCS